STLNVFIFMLLILLLQTESDFTSLLSIIRPAADGWVGDFPNSAVLFWKKHRRRIDLNHGCCYNI
ncbi:MAG: hypothetical protein ACI4LJ_00755, partial [Anaerovoracaceae bacterium]